MTIAWGLLPSRATMAAKKTTAMGPSTRPSRARGRKWSQQVTESSDALDLEPGAFKGSSRQVATSLKRSADWSRRRKSDSFRSAMSMLTFDMNRAGAHLSPARGDGYSIAQKEELRALYGRAAERTPDSTKFRDRLRAQPIPPNLWRRFWGRPWVRPYSRASSGRKRRAPHRGA